VAGKIVLTADHPTLLNDLSDISFVKAEVSTDTSVTFKISGVSHMTRQWEPLSRARQWHRDRASVVACALD
jgi:hypothetical protein